MNKRRSGPPRRPRNPIAKAVREPKYRPRVIPDKRWRERLSDEHKTNRDSAEHPSDKTGQD